MKNNYQPGQQVNYHGHTCVVESINSDGTLVLSYDIIPFMPVRVMDANPNEVTTI